MIKAITFDLDGVYFINGKSNFISNIVKLGVSEDEAKRVFLRSNEMNLLYKAGKMTDQTYWNWAIKEWRLEKTPEELIKLLIEGYEVDDNVVQAIKKLRAKGYKALICTNNFPARINGLQERFGFLNNFDAWVFSYEAGITKPSSEMFQKLIDISKVLPEEIVYSDDNADNVEKAKRLGIKAFLFEGFDNFMERLKILGVSLD